MPDVLAPTYPFSFAPGGGMASAPDAGAPAPPPPVDPIKDRMLQNLDRQQQAIDRTQSAMDRQEQIGAEKTRALAPLRQKQMELATQQLPSPPAPTQPPAPPQRNSRHDDEDWLQMAGLVGALAGAFTRNHVTNALGAMQGMMEGYNEGSRQKFDQNMRLWDTENKKAVESNKAALDHYREVLENRKLNLDQMSMELQMAAAQYDDKAMEQAARSKNTLVIAQLYDKQAQSLSQFEKSAGSLAAQHAEAKQRELDKMAQQYVESPAGQAIVKAIGEGRAPMPPTSQRTGFEGARNAAIRDRVLMAYPGFSATQFGINKIEGETPARAARSAETVRATIDPRAEGRTVTEFDVGMASRSVQSLNVAIDHLDALQELANGLHNKDMNAINQLTNYFKREFGQPAPTNFDAAKQIVAQEVVKAVVNNGGSMQERQEASAQISNARSPAQLHGVIETYKRLMAGQLEGLKTRYESGSHRSDFEDKLRPGTRRELGGLASKGPAAAASDDPIRGALNAIAKGAPPEAVIKRLQEHGIDPSALFDAAGM